MNNDPACQAAAQAARRLAAFFGRDLVEAPLNTNEAAPSSMEASQAEDNGLDSDFRMVQGTAGMLHVAVVDHLRSLANLVEAAEPTVLGMGLVCRSGLEAAGRLTWIVDANLTPRQRVGRCFGLNLRSLRYEAAATKKSGIDATPLTSRIEALTARAVRLGISLDSVPGEQELVRQIRLKSGDKNGAILYHELSGHSHGQPLVVLQHLDSSTSDEQIGRFPAVTRQRVARYASLQLESSGWALGEYATWCGVSTEGFAATWLDGLESLLQFRLPGEVRDRQLAARSPPWT